MQPNVPELELEALRMALADVEEMASDGDVSAGYDHLLNGLYHAMDLSRDGELWADQLVRAYRCALADYRSRYCVR